MRDINFFEPYLEQDRKQEERKPKLMLIRAIFIFLVVAIPLCMGGLYLYNMREIARMNNELSDPQMQANLTRINDKLQKLSELKAVLPILEQGDRALKETNFVNDAQLQMVVGSIPQNLVVNTMNLGIKGCTINGLARNKASIAELEYNLRNTNSFEGILLSECTLVGTDYDFTMSFILKGVPVSEAN